MPDGAHGEVPREYREIRREMPVMTAYVLRHGETTKDKTNPKRGLTPEGESQLDQAAERLMSELDPDKDIIQVFDSGNPRAELSVMRVAERLKEGGFTFFSPIKMRWDPQTGEMHAQHEGLRTIDEPKSRSRRDIGAANIPDEYKAQLDDPERHRALGIPETIQDKRVATWFLADWPDEVERPEQVNARVEEGIALAEKRVAMLAKQLGPGKRIVVVSAANATAIDAVVSARTGLTPVERGGGIENAEGFKVDFSLNENPTFSVWGKDIETRLQPKIE
ncbi:MAG: histidine phosphatase family protein [Candidatus Magasanikbacteria bacterium]|nr:histidine phosphatase family protein [Candidatus Magasanikbacteria bacterium]